MGVGRRLLIRWSEGFGRVDEVVNGRRHCWHLFFDVPA